MIPVVSIKSVEFDRAVRAYAEATKKDSAQVLTDKAFFIARRATWTTDKADVNKIEADLGVIGHTVRMITRGKNAGAVRRTGYITSNSSLAERIVRSRIYAGQGQQPSRTEIVPAVRRFISRRRSAVGFIRSGWTEAAKYLSKFAKRAGAMRASPGSNPKVNRVVGGGIKAVPSVKPKATIWNEAASNYGNNQKAAQSMVEDGLRKSVAEEVRDMETYTAKVLQQTSNRFRSR